MDEKLEGIEDGDPNGEEGEPDVQRLSFSLTRDSEENDAHAWGKLTKFYKASRWEAVTVGHLAERCQLEWIRSRAGDRVGDFVTLRWQELLQRSGFGRKKLRLLTDILLAGCDMGEGMVDAEKGAPPLAEVELWGIQGNAIPLELGAFSARAVDLFERENLCTLADLDRYVGPEKDKSLLELQNVGKRTVKEIHEVVCAWRMGDRKKLKAWIPLDASEALSPAIAIDLNARGLSEQKQVILKRRLGDGLTLEEVAEEAGVTRERVRQIEASFLAFVGRVFRHFQDVREVTFAEWAADRRFSFFDPKRASQSPIVEAGVRTFLERSEAGKIWKANRDKRTASVLEKLRNDWLLYTGTLDLDAKLAELGASDLREVVLKEGIRRRVWRKLPDGQLTLCSMVPKRAALANLRWRNESVVWAEEWLEELRQCPAFSEMDLESLRRSYHNWHVDAAFGSWQVEFPESVCKVASPEKLADEQSEVGVNTPPSPEAVRPEAEQRKVFRLGLTWTSADGNKEDGKKRLPKPEHDRPEVYFDNWEMLLELEERISDSIAAARDRVIIGLLVLDGEIERGAVKAVKQGLERDSRRLESLFRSYPAVASLATSLAVGMMDDHQFWKALGNAFGVNPTQVFRERLPTLFKEAVRRLGLEYEYEDSDDGQRLLRPILFQAGFTPYMISRFPLLFGSNQILPDPDEPEGVSAFCRQQAERKAISGNFARILRSPSGALVVATILRAFQKNDFKQLPVHFQAPLEEVFAASDRDVLLKRPYLAFDVSEGEPVVVFPRPPRKLRTATSEWRVTDGPLVNALDERRLSVATFAGERVAGTLEGVGLTRDPIRFELPIQPSADQPCFFFDADSGRLVRPVQVEHCKGLGFELPVGLYLAWVGDPEWTNDPEVFGKVTGGWIGEIEIAPVSQLEPFEINKGSRRYIYRARSCPAVVFDGLQTVIARTVDGLEVFGDDLPQIDIYLPVIDPQEAVRAEVEIHLGDAINIVLLEADATGENSFSAHNISSQVEEMTSKLASGAVSCSICVCQRGAKVERQFVIWKGLKWLSEGDGFACREVPANLNWKASFGIRQNGCSIAFEQLAFEVALAFNDLRLTFLRPGVVARIEDSEAAIDSSLRWPENSSEKIVFETADHDAWHLYCDDIAFGKIGGRTRRRHSVAFADLVAQFGPHGMVEARRGDERRILFRFVAQRVGASLRFSYDAGYRNHKGVLFLREDHALGLRMGRQSLLNGSKEIEWTPWLSLEEGDRWQSFTMGPEWNLCLRVRQNGLNGENDRDPSHRNRVWRVDVHSHVLGGCFCDLVYIEVRRTEGEETPLLVDDFGTPSQGILFFSNLINAPQRDLSDLDSWGRMLAAAISGTHIGAIAERAVSECRAHAEWIPLINDSLRNKYHRQVWAEIKWLRPLYASLVRAAFENGDARANGELLERAIKGLEWRSTAQLASITSTLTIACHEEVAAQPALRYPELVAEGPVLSAMSLLAEYGRTSLAEMGRREECRLPSFEHFLRFFDGVGQAVADSCSALGRMDYQQWLESMEKELEDMVVPRRIPGPGQDLLSAAHLAYCLERLSRRLQRSNPRHEAGPDDPLLRLGTRLWKIGNDGSTALNGLRPRLEWPSYLEIRLPMNRWILAESREGAIGEVIFGLGALMRLRARRRLDRDSFSRHLRGLLGIRSSTEPVTDQLTVLLSFGPELFAFALLFWEIALNENERN